jgi:hypothetical protein
MAGRQLRSGKTTDSVSSEDEFTQYSQTEEFEDNSTENGKLVEQGETTGTVIAERTSDVLDRELEIIREEDEVEIPLGQPVESCKLAQG